MNLEIERKFLVANDGWIASATHSDHYRDGLIARFGGGKVRVRRGTDRAWLTVKGPRQSLSRAEYEYEIPLADADELLATVCVGAIIEKVRHWVPHGGRIWSIDVHLGALADVVIAEVELDAESDDIAIPPWAGREVTGDPAFRKQALLKRATDATPTSET